MFGQISEILKALQQVKAPIQNENWALIDPQIVKVSQKLFVDGHYSNAACDAFIEINDRVKKLYKTYHPEAIELPDGQTLMNKVFADKDPILEVCDLSKESGRNMQLGTRFMLAGAMAALRNPKTHANIPLSSSTRTMTTMYSRRRTCFSKLDDLRSGFRCTGMTTALMRRSSWIA